MTLSKLHMTIKRMAEGNRELLLPKGWYKAYTEWRRLAFLDPEDQQPVVWTSNGYCLIKEM